MSKKQWIWLIVAVLVFALAGAASVAVNAWRAQSVADMYDSMYDSIYGAAGNMFSRAAYTSIPVFPDEPFIARVDIEGTIMSNGAAASVTGGGFDLDYILDYIDRLTYCEDNAGILLYVDSGGGEIKASDEVYLKLMDYKAATGRPVYAYFDGTACSGAYYIAMAADNIWANRNCVCVNIGVYVSA